MAIARLPLKWQCPIHTKVPFPSPTALCTINTISPGVSSAILLMVAVQPKLEPSRSALAKAAAKCPAYTTTTAANSSRSGGGRWRQRVVAYDYCTRMMPS